MEFAMDVLKDIHHRIGGGVVYLDAEDKLASREARGRKTMKWDIL